MNSHHDEEEMLTSLEYNFDTELTQSTALRGSTQFERRAFSGPLGMSIYAPTRPTKCQFSENSPSSSNL
ncbi:hypothetical protein ACFX15_003587 [Malus domestica]